MEDKYRVESATVEHFFKLVPRDYDSRMVFSNMVNPEIAIRNYISGSYSFTGFYGDDIIAVAGLTPLWPGTAEAWLFSGTDLAKHPKFVLRQLKIYLDRAVEIFNVHRIQAVVIDEFPQAHEFIKRLGFICETPDGMKHYGQNGETYKMYARIIDG